MKSSAITCGTQSSYTVIKNLAVANVFKYDAEKRAHGYFNKKHVLGEWFKISESEIEKYYLKLSKYFDSKKGYYPNTFFDISAFIERRFDSLKAGDRINFLSKDSDNVINEISKVTKWFKEFTAMHPA